VLRMAPPYGTIAIRESDRPSDPGAGERYGDDGLTRRDERFAVKSIVCG
jgi:hypothetical protein